VTHDGSSAEENTNPTKTVKVKSENEDEKDNGTVEKKRIKRDSESHAAPHKEPAKSKKKKAQGPMHFTANNEPRALDVLGELDPAVFNEVGLRKNSTCLGPHCKVTYGLIPICRVLLKFEK